MKVVILNKSDATGGAAVVSRRLMEALREEGVDARMLVCEKLSDSPYVEKAAADSLIKKDFLLERLKIFISNGFNRATLFKIDTASEGLPLWKHPLVKEADAILINWVNQGMLSLKGFRKILSMRKPVLWTMHDMWCMTGICHHAGICRHYLKECGNCPLLNKKASPSDLSHKIWEKKKRIYSNKKLTSKLAFVAVSTWLKGRSNESALLRHNRVEVIHNAFKLPSSETPEKFNAAFPGPHSSGKIRILFGAARLDDPIKGLDTLRETARILKRDYPDISESLEIAVFGNVKNETALEGFELPLVRLGILHGEDEVRKAYERADIVVSASSYETLPGTLVEAQAYGCIPVSFNQGGQSDIVDNASTGFIVAYDEEMEKRSLNLAKGIEKAVEFIKERENHLDFLRRMKMSVDEKFSYHKIAIEYIKLIENLRELPLTD